MGNIEMAALDRRLGINKTSSMKTSSPASDKSQLQHKARVSAVPLSTPYWYIYVVSYHISKAIIYFQE